MTTTAFESICAAIRHTYPKPTSEELLEELKQEQVTSYDVARFLKALTGDYPCAFPAIKDFFCRDCKLESCHTACWGKLICYWVSENPPFVVTNYDYLQTLSLNDMAKEIANIDQDSVPVIMPGRSVSFKESAIREWLNEPHFQKKENE